ncbi:MAG TPA: ATP-binding cassette domain-containing protein [Gaiellaceae bacterium]
MAEYVYSMYRANKFYGPDRQVLADISLSFIHGAKIGVLGPNGAGKSTLLRTMAGREETSSQRPAPRRAYDDLDVDTLRALEDALLDFAGCAVVITHDRYFLDRVATHILAFEGDSQVTWFEGTWARTPTGSPRRAGPRRWSRIGSSTSRSSACRRACGTISDRGHESDLCVS